MGFHTFSNEKMRISAPRRQVKAATPPRATAAPAPAPAARRETSREPREA